MLYLTLGRSEHTILSRASTTGERTSGSSGIGIGSSGGGGSGGGTSRGVGSEWDWPHLVCAQSLNEHSVTHRLGYHDVFAHRVEGHDSVDKTWMFDTLANSLLNEGTDLIPVHSCFSGLAIYDPRAIELCDYDEFLCGPCVASLES